MSWSRYNFLKKSEETNMWGSGWVKIVVGSAFFFYFFFFSFLPLPHLLHSFQMTSWYSRDNRYASLVNTPRWHFISFSVLLHTFYYSNQTLTHTHIEDTTICTHFLNDWLILWGFTCWACEATFIVTESLLI